jgi:hypothetical protein
MSSSQNVVARSCRKRAYLEEIVDDKAVLTCEEAITASEEKP